ncbi:MAG: hypothetical protein AB1696_14755 [Planctomycetota bacterium]
MEMDFYTEWLGIPGDQRPPNHYQLLGVQPFEANKEAIEKAARERAAVLKTYEIGKYSAQSQVLLTEIARARADLLNPKRKDEYDRRLRGGEKAPQIEVDSLEIFTNLVAFSMPRGNLSKEHLASLFAEAKRLKIPQPQAQTIIQPMLAQAKRQRQAEAAARAEAERKKEEDEHAVRRRATAKKCAVVALLLAVVVAVGFYGLRFIRTVEEKKKVEQVRKEEQKEKNQRDECLARAVKAQREEKWQEAAEHYEKALALGDDDEIKMKLAAMKGVLQAIHLEGNKKWADAAAAYQEAAKGMGAPDVFKEKLAFLALAREYETAYADGAAQEKAGKLNEARAAFEKAVDLAGKTRIETDAANRLAQIKAAIEKRADRLDRARHLLDIAAERKDYEVLYAVAGFYLSGGGDVETAAKSKGAADGALKGQPKPDATPEALLSACAEMLKDKRPYQALREIGRLQYYFSDSRACKDEAYQAEVMGKVGDKIPKTLREALAQCVAFGETMCPDCMGSGRLPCRECGDTGKTEKTCDVCNGRGRIRGCEACKGSALQQGPCAECKGTGTWRCRTCRGKGCKFCQENPKRDCTACKGAGTGPTRKKCPQCLGSGKVAGGTCSICKGKGKPICEACEGTGMKPCAKCQGKGKMEVQCRFCAQGRHRKCLKCGGAGQIAGQ